jgi:hypothetical protein
MDDDLLTLGLQLDGGPDADAEELDELTRQLRSELLELDVHSVDPGRTGGPRRPVRGPLTSWLSADCSSRWPDRATHSRMLISVIQSFLHAQPTRSVELQIAGDTLKMSGVSEQQQLIELFVQRHGLE